MLALEIFGRIEKSYGPTIGCKTRVEGLSPKDVCQNILEFRKLIEEGADLYWIKVYVNGKFVSPDFFLERHKDLWYRKPKLLLFFEFMANRWILVDAETHEEVCVGDGWKIEQFLEINQVQPEDVKGYPFK